MGFPQKYFDPRTTAESLHSVYLRYTQTLPDVRFDRVKIAGSRLLIALLAFAPLGCWVPIAVEYAPAALQTAESLGAHAVAAAQGPAGDTPGVIELRRDASGSAEYREMRIDVASNQPCWTPVSDRDTAADGWRPAENLMQMNFKPPLTSALSNSKTIYLAYAPLDAGSSDTDREKLEQFNRSFGAPVGTFDWNGHSYQYSLPRVLPTLQFD